jgi:hypothetical protein
MSFLVFTRVFLGIMMCRQEAVASMLLEGGAPAGIRQLSKKQQKKMGGGSLPWCSESGLDLGRSSRRGRFEI